MKSWHKAALVAALVALAGLALCAPSRAPRTVAGSTVKIDVGNGHGSGVSIGEGYILTAAHVVDKAKSLTIKADNGMTRSAELLWSNEAYDVALLRVQSFRGLATSPLACRVPGNGEAVTASGNPSNMEFLTFRGFVNGIAREIGPWKLAVPVDMTIIGGMSGGPVLDASGNVVGLSVGHSVIGIGFSASWTRIGVVVTGKTICELMGRA